MYNIYKTVQLKDVPPLTFQHSIALCQSQIAEGIVSGIVQLPVVPKFFFFITSDQSKIGKCNSYNTAGFNLTSWRPCWCTLNNKTIMIISFVWYTNMAAMSIILSCVSWDCMKTKNKVNLP